MKILTIHEVAQIDAYRSYTMESTKSVILITDATIKELYDKENFFLPIISDLIRTDSIIDIECHVSFHTKNDTSSSTIDDRELKLSRKICTYFQKTYGIVVYITFNARKNKTVKDLGTLNNERWYCKHGRT